MTDPTSTVAGDLVAALQAAIITAVNDPDVLVVVGFPWPQTALDIISVGDVKSNQTTATMTPQRTRDEVLTVDVTVSVFRPGGQEQALPVIQRAYALLGLIGHHFRMDVPTLGIDIWECLLTDHQMSSQPFSSDTAEGRTTEIAATFTTKARIRG